MKNTFKIKKITLKFLKMQNKKYIFKFVDD